MLAFWVMLGFYTNKFVCIMKRLCKLKASDCSHLNVQLLSHGWSKGFLQTSYLPLLSAPSKSHFHFTPPSLFSIYAPLTYLSAHLCERPIRILAKFGAVVADEMGVLFLS